MTILGNGRADMHGSDCSEIHSYPCNDSVMEQISASLTRPCGCASYLRVHVRQLRQKIEADPERPQFVLTETGIGYRLRAPD